MAQRDAEPPGEHDAHGDVDSPEPEFSIAQSNALAPLLILFGVTVLAIFLSIVRAKPIAPPEGAPAAKAFSPVDFPAVFSKDEALAGLEPAAGGGPKKEFPVPAPPFSEDIFPCSGCHADMDTDSTRREFTDIHSDIRFEHDAEHRWCLDCHDSTDRDQLKLASGERLPFTESYRLCGQCHGTQFRDWKEGIHGKRTGYWEGAKRYLLCVNCHNPHSPHFKPLQPLPPPVRPNFLRPEDAARAAAAMPPAGGNAGAAGEAPHG